MSIGEQLRAERLRQKLTVRQLADLSGVTKNTISNVENERIYPRLDILEKMARALNCEIQLMDKDE